MIELICLSVFAILGISLYINENMLHKDKIEFDLLQDRQSKKVSK